MRHGTLRQAVRWRRHVSLCLVLVFVRCVTAQSAVIQFAIPGDIDWRTAQQPPFSPASYFPGIDYALSTTGIAPLDTTLVIDVPTLPADITVDELGPQEWANVSGFAAHLARDDVYAVTNVIDDGDTLVYSGQLLIAAGEGLPISPASIRQLTESGVDQVRVMVNLAHAVLWSRNPQTRFESLLWSPTLFEGQLNDQQLRTNLEYLIDADPSTAFVRVDGLNRVVEKRSVVIRMDLVSRFPIGLVRFYPRPRAGNGSLTISGYSIDVNDGINLKPAPTGQLSRVTNATYELLGDEALRSDGVPRYELLQTGQGNDLDTVSVVIDPPQYLRFLQFNSLTALDFDVAEREVFNQGFPPLVTYVTRPLPFNSAAVTTMLDYQGGNLDRRAELDALPGATLGRVFWDERSIGDAARSGAVVSMRTGITPEPLLLWRVNGNGDAVEWRTDTHVVDYRDDSPTRNQSVWLDDPLLRSSSRSIWETLPAVERVVAQTTVGEYIRLPAATRRDQNGDALPRVVDHSSWGGGFQPLENGQVMSAPGGRPFFQLRVDFSSSDPGSATIIENLRFELQVPPAVSGVYAEIAPAADIDPAADTLFTYALRLESATGDEGVNRVRARYDQPTQSVYELVEDNDDQDRHPDWQRRGQGAGDRFVFPGWDENGDFVADFNQNNVDIIRPNLNPDWEEPFLRYHVDRPRFLFGVDMNNNGYIDRFENDDEPDYPYKRDRRGYNVYVGADLGPFARLSIGRQDERQLADDRRNETNYLLLTYERDFATAGRVQVFDNLRRARDDIEDDIFIWRIADGIAGELHERADPLPARNAWANTFYVRHDFSPAGMNLQSKLKYEFFHQLDDTPSTSAPPIRRTASFFGMVNKLAYSVPLAGVTVEPRWKSEFQRLVPSLLDDPLDQPTTELTESAFLIAHFPLLSRTTIQFGLEYLWTKQFRKSVESTLEGSPRKELVTAVQVANQSPYLGYVVFTQLGFRVARIDIDVLAAPQTETFIFFTVYAGFGN